MLCSESFKLSYEKWKVQQEPGGTWSILMYLYSVGGSVPRGDGLERGVGVRGRRARAAPRQAPARAQAPRTATRQVCYYWSILYKAHVFFVGVFITEGRT